MQKENPWLPEERKNKEIISRNCLPHHKRSSTFTNTNKAMPLYLLSMLSRYYAMSENVQRDSSRDCKKENPYFKRRKKKKEIISRNCLPHHKTASTFINTHKQARLHLLPVSSRYYAMSESMQHDDHRSSFHDMVHFRYDKQRPALHAEGLNSQQMTWWQRRN
jgi:hypothetical protein